MKKIIEGWVPQDKEIFGVWSEFDDYGKCISVSTYLWEDKGKKNDWEKWPPRKSG